MKQDTFKSLSLDLKEYFINVIECEDVLKVKYTICQGRRGHVSYV